MRFMINYEDQSAPPHAPLEQIIYEPNRTDRSKSIYLFQIGWKSVNQLPMGRQSSLHEYFVRVETPTVLERFEVEKSRAFSRIS